METNIADQEILDSYTLKGNWQRLTVVANSHFFAPFPILKSSPAAVSG